MTDAAPLLPGALNFRDVGGLAAVGGHTRSGVLYRSGHLARVSAESLQALGLRRIIDLRGDDERAFEPTPWEGLRAAEHRIPLFLGSAASFIASDISLAELNRQLIDGSALQVVEVVRGVLADQPVLVHCTVGKDRTGLAVALTLAASGVDEGDIVRDYARTEAALPAERNSTVMAYLRRIHPNAVHLEEVATRSPVAVMRGVLDELRHRYGAPVEYLRAHGLGDDEIVELRKVLVTG